MVFMSQLGTYPHTHAHTHTHTTHTHTHNTHTHTHTHTSMIMHGENGGRNTNLISTSQIIMAAVLASREGKLLNTRSYQYIKCCVKLIVA
jgi:hypothetical protein